MKRARIFYSPPTRRSWSQVLYLRPTQVSQRKIPPPPPAPRAFTDPKLWMDTPAWVGNAKAATSIIEAVKTIPTIIQISFAKNLDSIKIGFDILRELASNPTTNPDVVRDALLRLIAEFAAVPKRKQLGSNNNRSSKFFQPFFTNHLFLGLPEIYQKQLRAMVPALKAKTSYEEFE